MDLTAVIPIKGFPAAKERLSPGLDPASRAAIAAATAGRVIKTCVDVGYTTIVVTADGDVAALASDLGATPVAESGTGLDAAAAAGIAVAAGPWLVVHADLPLLDASSLHRARGALEAGRWVIAAARDGGTNLLGGVGAFEFSYGPGSFHRHLGRIAASGNLPLILVDEATALEIDTPRDLAVAAHRPGGGWLLPFLS